ncbi:ADP-ribosyl-[dinitrogen reductase] glycohydrolase-like isoform X2 [Babylonia areolata]|uniref:ADP-ribosyl-[dinitrogen reductase] glycohydrolase-like isoform X2 n=1 Tax=Babylonia areolata TaxID=304850 RepID=UPI003FD699DC
MASSTNISSEAAKVPNLEEIEARNAQIRATIYGQCIGDAIGLLTEFMSKEDAEKEYKQKNLEYSMKVPDIHRSRWKTGDWTDDSDQMLLILLSLLDNGGQVSVQDFAERMKNWMNKGFAELGDFGGLGIGRTTNTVLRHPKFVTDPHSVAYEVWDSSGRNIAPNGGVMRTSVVGTHCWWDVDRVVDTALGFVRCTHYDQRCQASAVAVSVCISLMLQRQPRHMDRKGRHYNVDALIKDSFDHAANCLEKEEDKQLLWQYMSCKKLKELKLAEPVKIGFTYKSMGSGFWALKKDDFRKAIQKITMEGGDADTNACVAGAVLGCKLGWDSIPSSWKGELKHKDWLDQHIERWLSFQKEMAVQKQQVSEGSEKASSQ